MASTPARLDAVTCKGVLVSVLAASTGAFTVAAVGGYRGVRGDLARDWDAGMEAFAGGMPQGGRCGSPCSRTEPGGSGADGQDMVCLGAGPG